MTRAVVFAYHDVGVRCLDVLLRHGVEVPLVVTHADNPAENIWFGSVADRARGRGIETITPADPNTPEIVARVAAARPDFLFSFYYRQMLKSALLAIPTRGAYNMHGSLLPKYRGRAPVNWAIIHGETETGATLHAMTEKPDNGAIVAQEAVPIGIDDNAREVFDKVTGAAGRALDRALPALIAGTAPHLKQDLSKGAYFGGRKPEDGRISFKMDAADIHNLVRAVAPPHYPGAYEEVAGDKIVIGKTRLVPASQFDGYPARYWGEMFLDHGRLYARCGDGKFLEVLELQINGQSATLQEFVQRYFAG